MSIGLLASIKASISTLTGRLTSTRAGYLDNLDAAISTRAASATALSSATWTAPRAAKLDEVGIKSIQQGTITVTISGGSTYGASNTATITSVSTSKSVCFLLGVSRATNANAAGATARVVLTNSTTVTAHAQATTADVGAFTVGYVVVEFN